MPKLEIQKLKNNYTSVLQRKRLTNLNIFQHKSVKFFACSLAP